MAHRKTARDARTVAFDKLADDESLGDPGDAASWEAKAAGNGFNMPAEMLPAGTRAVGFRELAEMLGGSPDGRSRMEGVERGSAGLEPFRMTRFESDEPGAEVGAAFSFCLEGWTFTAFEDPSDGYRSSLAFLVAREGNFCSETFEPCPMLPRLRTARRRSWDVEEEGAREAVWALGETPEGHADIFELVEPSTGRVALAVGTDRGEDWYPRFVGAHDPELLCLASAAGAIPAGAGRKMRL